MTEEDKKNTATLVNAGVLPSKVWVYTALSLFIAGAAVSAESAIGNLAVGQDWKVALEAAGMTCVISGARRLLAFIVVNPLPALSAGQTSPAEILKKEAISPIPITPINPTETDKK